MGKLTLVIGNKNYSSWSLRPWFLMKYFKIPFEEIIIPLFVPGFKEKILEHSPSGKVPLLKHGKIIVWESIAIADYLADLFPKEPLWPQDPAKKAMARAVSAEMHAGFVNLRKTCPMNVRERKTVEISSEVKADIERILKIWSDCRKAYAKDGPFLFGEFSIADAMYSPVVFRFQTYGIKLEGICLKYSETILNLPVIKEWIDAANKEPHKIEHH